MLTRMVFAAAAVLLSLPTLAQATQPAATELVGTLTGTNVAVRSGPSTTGAYRCTKLTIGDKVVVLQSKGEWLQIKPTKGTFSVIAKKYVQPDASGKAGSINGDNVWVRAGGELCTFTAVTDFYVLQGQLNKGDAVTILGEAGDYYRVAPPSFATFWIAAKYVDLGGQKAPDDATGPAIDTGTVTVELNGAESTTQPFVKAAAPVDVTTQPSIDPNTVAGKIETVRQEMLAEYNKPLEQRDLPRMIAKFKAIDTNGSDYGKKLVDYYVQYMENQLKQLKELEAVRTSSDEMKNSIAKIQKTIAEREITAQTVTGPKAFNAEGVIKPSGLFPGTKATPKRWVVRDPYNSRITAYVQCTNGEVDLDAYVGQHVGVWGSETFDKELGLYIVDAQKVQPVKGRGSEPTPPGTETQPATPTPAEPVTPAEPAVKPTPATQPTTVPAASQPLPVDDDQESLVATPTTTSAPAAPNFVSPDKLD